MKKAIRLFAVGLMLICILSSQVALAGGEYTVATGGGRLNMRKKASTTATVILYIPNGTPVDDKSSSVSSVSGWKYIGSWGYLSGETAGYNHYKKGWVQSKFLQ